MANLIDGYDAEFVTQLYRIFFDREPDSSGLEHHLAALNSGSRPHHLIASFLHSDEFLARWRQKILPHSDLPNLKDMYPQYYEDDLYLATENQRINLMEELIRRYSYYDNFGVWGSMIDNDKRNMANLVCATGAKSCLEVGCFNGPTLSVLQGRGVEVTGIDLSHLAFTIAYPNIKGQLLYGDLLSVGIDRTYDCILLLDIMEHLNPLRLDRYIRRLRELLSPNGLIILNSPMFGFDPTFGTVFQQDLRQWRDIGDRTFFRHWPCDGKGWPMHGHLIWAAPNWWTEQFAGCGLVRQWTIEQTVQDNLARYFLWAPARKSLALFSHEQAVVDSDRICSTISQQRWH